ncbi:hypothetical protein ROCKET24_47 [Vibrio phage Rocket24]|uniref:Uncharacterized protein n=2 Tax=Thalassavirus TaxID=2948922 RepID=A0A6G8R504_9CAUD|nr:hypothetical protein KNU88_gp048 [Vibrio phage Chester]YP_010114219.1 hypothetical protein KNV71_gp049 [Vibrio phage Gary]QIG66170.1 hypothetical protein CILSICK_49 [Vibrio phage Cilsick]WBU77054.1 hypothetical protein NOELLE_48 [Vibrio phage Noelle]WCD55742.1 hypothetical protein ROCKET24_47 [Vibrio phage Rocket24]QIN96475.1 hypothetical protein CHESTER_48 [Vibrio phage Chester]QQV88153.1 hypothetical protein GARY_49 [Vibrio phage Gary]
MNKVEHFNLDGNLPANVKSVGFYVNQVHIEEVGNGLRLYRDFDMCYYNEGAVTNENIGIGNGGGMDDTPWLNESELPRESGFTLRDVEVIFGDEIELPEGYEVYWISLQPNLEVPVVFAIKHKTDCPQGKWFIPES